jgi:arsenate reductase-like glutaredoxin family protein
MPTLYGIKNCDTMKKARAWLEAHATAPRVQFRAICRFSSPGSAPKRPA